MIYFISKETAVKMEFDKTISKYRERRLMLMKERREYETDYGHTWCINLLKAIEKDLKELRDSLNLNKESLE